MYCNERTVTHCPICGVAILIATTINHEALPDGGTHQSHGDMFVVTDKCKHLTIDGGHYDGYDTLFDKRSYRAG